MLHLLLAVIIYAYRPAGQFLLFGTLGFWIFYIILKDNKNNEALMAAAYIAGAEVLYRMTGSMAFYETGKYSVILFLLIGMFYKGTSSKTVSFWIYLLILFPGVIVASFTLDYEVEFRKAIAFNLSGPVTLGVSALYCYYKKITKTQFNYVLLMLLLPLIANMIYLYLYTPSIGESLMRTGTNSNYAASGGYGPNQISTVMGMGMIILFTRLFLIKHKLINLIDLGLLALISYRALVTFSRGGVLTAVICIIGFLVVYFYKQDLKQQKDILRKLVVFILVFVSMWIYTSIATGGLIVNRYAGKDAQGQLKDDITTGRTELIITELQGFYHNPVIGIGVGKGKGLRSDMTGIATASHNEISRLLSEHGILGLFAVLILIAVPIIFWTKFKNNYYFLAFLAFWFLTINHSAMRIALPAFVYGLALLYIVDDKKHPVHRKRLTG